MKVAADPVVRFGMNSPSASKGHEYRLVSRHESGYGTKDVYDYCPRCGTLRRTCFFGDRVSSGYPVYSDTSGAINATAEPDCR